MKILFICNKSPYPPIEGGPIAMNALIEGLAATGNEVKVIALSTNKFPVRLDAIPEDYRRKTGLELVDVNLGIRAGEALKSMLNGKCYIVERFQTPQLREKIRQVIENDEFDIIQFETLYTAGFIDDIRQKSRAKLVYRAHNIEPLIWQRLAESSDNRLKKLFFRHLASCIRKFERKVLHGVDGILPITFTDAEYYRKLSDAEKVFPVPFGVHPDDQPAIPLPQPIDFFHIGSMNWMPNKDAVDRFLIDIWPPFTKQFPEARLHLAGRHMPDVYMNMNFGSVINHGEVPDARQFIGEHAVMVVPLTAGSGVRIKIIEAMQSGRPVISTPTGAEGIEYTDGVDILIANTPEEFRQKMAYCHQNPSEARQLGLNGRKLIREKHNNTLITGGLAGFYRKLQAGR